MYGEQNLVGRKLGNYRLRLLLGRGGQASVYLGEHVLLHRLAAIKVLRSPLSEKDRVAFQREAEILANLDHPHIVRILDFDIQDDMAFLVMEYYPYGTLRQRHPKGERVSLPTVVSYVKQVAQALQYAHGQHLIHRDVKPENMLIGRHQEILLSDFGIVAIAHSTSSSNTQDRVGTVYYMAPEQMLGHPRTASDQYALGVVTYEWLCGQCPFEGTLPEVVAKHLTVRPPSFQQAVPPLAAQVEPVVLRALAKEPQQRFATVQAFAVALERVSQVNAIWPTSALSPERAQDAERTVPIVSEAQAEQIGPVVSPSSRPEARINGPFFTVPLLPLKQAKSPKHHFSRRSVLVALATTAGISAGGAVIYRVQTPNPPSLSQISPATATPALSQVPSATATPHLPSATVTASPPYIYQGHSDAVLSVAWDPSGEHIASAGVDTTVQVWKASDGSNPCVYQGHSEQVTAIVWFPNGKRIASVSYNNSVQIWDAFDGSHRFSPHSNVGTLLAVTRSPNGERIAFCGENFIVQVCNAVNGGSPFTYQGHGTSVFSVAWSPDGKRIASGSMDNSVQVWDAANGNHLFTYNGHKLGKLNRLWSVAWDPSGKRIASASDDRTVQVWNAADGSHLFTSNGHFGSVFSVAWSPDGQRIASASNDKTVQVWNATDGSGLFTYRGHSSAVSSVAWSPDGMRIASGGKDGTVQVWDAP